MRRGLSKALSTFGREARNSIDQADELGDAGTSDLFTEVSRGMVNGCGLLKRTPRRQMRMET